MSKHTHTPWPKYQKSLTTAGYSVKLVKDIMDGLKVSSIAKDCPACKEVD